MRTYAPAATEPSSSACSRSRRSPAASSTTRSSPAARGDHGDVPGVARPADPRGPRGPRHRARCTSTRRRRSRRSTRGEDVVVVTPTASGKTLCYALPVLQAIAEDPSARALFLFPTKALGQDQVAEFAGSPTAQLARRSRRRRTTATRRRPIRSAIRKAGQVVVTNPDMLHSAILPHHTKWFQLFEQVRVIVIDELHTYRGVFGSHVANVLRRLLRLCAPLRLEPGDRVLLGDDREPGASSRRSSPAGRPG